MKQGFKLLTVLLMTLLLAASATAQINWLKQDGSVKYLAWDNGSNSKTIYSGDSATFMTGYFGSTSSQTVKLTATINNKNDGKIVSTIVSKEIKVANTLGYEVITILPEHYKNKVGEYIVVIKLKDANTELVDSSLYLKVNLIEEDNEEDDELLIPPIDFDFNKAPKMDALDDKEITENRNLLFTVSATDEDNARLEYEAKVCLKLGGNCLWFPVSLFGASFSSNTGEFSLTPSYDFVKHPSLSEAMIFRFRADDGDKKSAWEKITITVNDKNRNPKFNPIGNKVVQQEQLLQFTISATDADNDKLVYSIISKPAGASFDSKLRQFKWVPSNAQAGLYSVTFNVADGFGGKDAESIVIQVTDLLVEEPQCDDGLDNDGDSVVDENDPGCHTDGNQDNPGTYDKNDNNETDETVDKPQCNDGKDNDNDGEIDFPNDKGCSNENDNDESDDPDDEPVDKPQCKDGRDNDSDGRVDFPNDQGCSNENDNDESDDPDDEPNDDPLDRPQPQCKDGIDNDRDTLVDLQDPGCENNPEDNDESDDPNDEPNDDLIDRSQPQCRDGIDNDRDGKVDFPSDLGCSNEDDNNESDDPNDEQNDDPVVDRPQPASYTNIKFKSAHLEDIIVKAGELMAVHVSIFNNGKTDLKDVEIQATIYEIGAFGSTSDFDLPKNQGFSKSVYLYVPEEAQPGWHLVKITAKNYHYHTSTYRLVYIRSNTFK